MKTVVEHEPTQKELKSAYETLGTLAQIMRNKGEEIKEQVPFIDRTDAERLHIAMLANSDELLRAARSLVHEFVLQSIRN